MFCFSCQLALYKLVLSYTWILIFNKIKSSYIIHVDSYIFPIQGRCVGIYPDLSLCCFSYLTRSVFCTQDEIFGYCRFAPINDENQVLYITTMRGWYATLKICLNYLISDSASLGMYEELTLFSCICKDQGGSISKWSTTTWRRIKSKRVVRDPICAFNISPNGKLLAM